ncbi:MAG: Ig-like domain-containing protein [Pyrinomonadaceae bacterium]
MRAHRSTGSRAVRFTSSIILSAAVIFAAFAGVTGTTAKAAAPPMFAAQTFGVGSLIIPMDTAANGQDTGMLRAYGLVYELLRRGVPVNWVIDPAKASNGTDFTINGISATARDLRTNGPLSSRNYAGGPFVIDAANAAAATPIIFAWQATAGDATAVHEITGGSISVEVNRTLVAAPRIAILKDGFEAIAFNNLNAAGIRDSQGSVWSASSPDLLTEAAVAGPSNITHNDGALINQSNGLPRFSYLSAMHYIPTAATSEVVQETRAWLNSGSLVHAFLQCEAARVFENSGTFLTTSGITDDGAAAAAAANRVPSDPLTQIVDSFNVDSGAVDSIGLNPGSTFKTGVTTLINDSSAMLTSRISMMAGRLDGGSLNGRVTYLAGHDYSTALPVSTNPQTNGVRLMMNSIFVTDAASTAPADTMTVTKSAPAITNSTTIPYTINVAAVGSRPAENITITETLPAGTTYVVGSSTAPLVSIVGNTLTWVLPPLAAGGTTSFSYSATASSDGTYTSSPTRVSYSTLTVATATSNSVTTIVDTTPPLITIPGPPVNPNVFATNTPTFAFSVSGATNTTCRFDSGVFVPCTTTFTAAPPLINGPHTFEVRAADAAGNIATAIRAFSIVSVVLVSINVVPVNTTILTGRSQQFTAFGIYSDGAVQDITNSVTWSSSVITVARISNAVGTQGLATGLTAGTVQILARLGTVQGTATLTVTTLKGTKTGILTELRAALSTATSNKDKNNLKDAIKKLEKSLENGLWAADGNHLNCDHGNKVFGRERSAVKRLMAMIADTGTSNIPNTTIMRWINVLVGVDRELAQIAVSEATVSASVRAAAQAQIIEGDNDVADGNFDKAITHYKRAWKKVRSCGDDDDDDEEDDDNCGRHGH